MVSANSPITVEPIKRTQSFRSLVYFLIKVSDQEFRSWPIKKPQTLANTIRGTNPNIDSNALWFSQPSAAGEICTR